MENPSNPLDCAFYVQFYDDLALNPSDILAINEHYLTTGKRQGRVANRDELNRNLAAILHFNKEIYANANLSYRLRENLVTAWGQINWMDHFYAEGTGNLYIHPRLRVRNELELMEHANKWDALFAELVKATDLDLMFYRNYYDVPDSITNTRDLQLYIIKMGIFLGQKPNLSYLSNTKNAISDIQSALISKMGVDMSWLATNKPLMMEYMESHQLQVPASVTADENSLLLFLFLNTGYQLRVFSNMAEKDAYIADRSGEYKAAIAAVKALKQVDALAASTIEYGKGMIKAAKHIPMIGLPLVKLPFEQILNTLNLIKLTSDVYVACFKQTHGLELVDAVILAMVQHELRGYVNPSMNSMEVKKLVMCLVYNLNIEDKLDSKMYADFVKTKSIDLLTQLLTSAGIQDFAASLEQDVNFIIQNKEIVKMCSLKYALLSNVADRILLL